jgi:hypothetical protein
MERIRGLFVLMERWRSFRFVGVLNIGYHLEPAITATSEMSAYVYLLAVLQETKAYKCLCHSPSIQYPQQQKKAEQRLRKSV